LAHCEATYLALLSSILLYMIPNFTNAGHDLPGRGPNALTG
jgi:hypothetical protein